MKIKIFDLSLFGGRSQIMSPFREERGLEELVTIQTQIFSFFGKFVIRGKGGLIKVAF